MVFTIQIEAATIQEAMEQLQRMQAPASQPSTPLPPTTFAPAPEPATPTTVPINRTTPIEPTAAIQQQPPTAVPTAAPKTYTEDELMRAAAALMDAGKMNDIQQVLMSMGAQTFSQLPLARYGEFAMALKGLGAKL